MFRGWRKTAWQTVQLAPPSARESIHRIGKFLVDAGDGRSYDPTLNGEKQLIGFISREDGEGGVFLDAGCNLGDWTQLVLEANPEAKVFGFDISSRELGLYRQRFFDSANVRAMDYGLADAPRVTKAFLAPADQSGGNYVSEGFTGEQGFLETEVRLATGDDFLKNEAIGSVSLLKVDVEGFELQVLRGFDLSLRSGAIKAIQFEYNYAISVRHGLTLKHFIDFLDGSGFRLGRLRPWGIDFEYHYTWHDFESGPNFVWLQDHLCSGRTRIHF